MSAEHIDHRRRKDVDLPIDVKVARVVLADLGTESLHDLVLVEILADPSEFFVAEVATLALLAHVVDVLAGPLVRSDESIVAVDRGGNTRPNGLAVVAVLNQALAARKGIIHGLALAFVEDSRPATDTITTG